MKRKRTYKAPHRRRREKKTDYRKRLKLLKSKKPRFAVRKSLNSITCQIIEYNAKGDKTLVTASCKDLKKIGWKGHGGNIPAAYLTGLLCGCMAKKKKINEAVADMGLYSSNKWSRLYAALKGAADAGLSIPHSKETLPPDERVAGKHISSWAGKLKKDDPEKYKKMFSSYLKTGLQPEELEKHFEETKNKILK